MNIPSLPHPKTSVQYLGPSLVICILTITRWFHFGDPRDHLEKNYSINFPPSPHPLWVYPRDSKEQRLHLLFQRGGQPSLGEAKVYELAPCTALSLKVLAILVFFLPSSLPLPSFLSHSPFSLPSFVHLPLLLLWYS